jgi:Transglutaminase-like superfamily
VAVEQQSKPDSTFVRGALPRAGLWGGASLAAEVLGCYAWVRWLVLRRGPVEAVPVLRQGVSEHVPPDPDGLGVLRGLLFGRSVMRVLSLLPTDSRCLMRSLVLTRMLARRGVYTKVVIGVRQDPSFAAHAWVELDGQPLLPADDPTFHRLTEL